MLEETIVRTRLLQTRMKEKNIEIAVFTDESSIAYLAGFWGYLGIEFGRPTMLVIRPDEEPAVITPLMESEMVEAMTWVKDVRTWEDVGPKSWGRALKEAIGDKVDKIWIEKNTIPAIVRNFFDDQCAGIKLQDISPTLGELRMIKSPLEIEIMKQAGQIAGSMMKAAHESLIVGAQEYESALSVINAGTRKAAGFLTEKGWERFVSPMIHNLQIMQSGSDTSMVHRRANLHNFEIGDPVYFCFCNMVQFKQYKLGFDRMFHVNEISDKAAHVQQAAIDAQQAATNAIRPGVVLAEDIAAAANVIYQERGYETGYRTGRSIGVSYLEAPELKAGDKTVLQPGMTFAVDGGISIGGLGGRIGDSVVVTETGFDYITDYPRELLVT